MGERADLTGVIDHNGLREVAGSESSGSPFELGERERYAPSEGVGHQRNEADDHERQQRHRVPIAGKEEEIIGVCFDNHDGDRLTVEKDRRPATFYRRAVWRLEEQ